MEEIYNGVFVECTGKHWGNLGYVIIEKQAIIIGASKPEQIVENIEASKISLSSEILDEIDTILDNKPTFPYAHDGGPEEV